GAVIISLNARTMRAANVMASFIILPMSVVLQVEAALILLGRAEFLWGFALLMAIVAIVLVRMGFNGFSREALLAREVGLKNPFGRALDAVRASFAMRPTFFRLVWMRRIPMLIAAAIHMDARGGWSARVLAALADYVRALRWLVPALAVAAVLEVFLG